ncbi:hypothetical protein P3G67_35290 [Streptomyces sp. RB6PN23]|uniref:Uncharacterized protein n=1 Tax=Streptomyces silvisoli TaxID=3034235 RepID=A0ABT5ZXW6_9ACTN|nr:hypothetical protein [Streptomyces silvisoli]
MSKTPKKSHPPHGEGPTRFKEEGTAQHGWGPDIDDPGRDNPSAHRSFHPDEYAPKPDRSRPAAPESASSKGAPEKSGESLTRGAEEQATSGEKGIHDRGRKGRSQRPSGGKDASAYTGVDPQDQRKGKR